MCAIFIYYAGQTTSLPEINQKLSSNPNIRTKQSLKNFPIVLCYQEIIRLDME